MVKYLFAIIIFLCFVSASFCQSADTIPPREADEVYIRTDTLNFRYKVNYKLFDAYGKVMKEGFGDKIILTGLKAKQHYYIDAAVNKRVFYYSINYLPIH